MRFSFRFQLYYYSDNAVHGKKETVLIIDTRERVERQYGEVDDLDDTEMKDPLEKAIQSK